MAAAGDRDQEAVDAEVDKDRLAAAGDAVQDKDRVAATKFKAAAPWAVLWPDREGSAFVLPAVIPCLISEVCRARV